MGSGRCKEVKVFIFWKNVGRFLLSSCRNNCHLHVSVILCGCRPNICTSERFSIGLFHYSVGSSGLRVTWSVFVSSKIIWTFHKADSIRLSKPTTNKQTQWWLHVLTSELENFSWEIHCKYLSSRKAKRTSIHTSIDLDTYVGLRIQHGLFTVYVYDCSRHAATHQVLIKFHPIYIFLSFSFSENI